MALQRYISNEITHFVGRGLRGSPGCDESQYSTLLKILKDGELGRVGTGAGWQVVMMGKGVGTPLSSNEKVVAKQVCFCDIPPEDFRIHMQKYSEFGLAFTKAFMVCKGATPVFYVAQNALATQAHPTSLKLSTSATLGDVFNELGKGWEQFRGSGMRNGDFSAFEQAKRLDWCLFSQLKFFDSSKDESHEDNFYMEREWRVLGTLSFSLVDVVRIIVPKKFAKRFREDVPEYWGQLTFADGV